MNTQNLSALYLKIFERNIGMNFGEPEPSHLPSLNVHIVMRYKSKKENQLHSNPIISLLLLKSSSPYNSIINDVNYDRFLVHYWTVTEFNIYKLYPKNNIAPRITIDAIGGIVSKCKLITGRETSSIFFLYEVGIMDQIIYPTFELIKIFKCMFIPHP